MFIQSQQQAQNNSTSNNINTVVVGSVHQHHKKRKADHFSREFSSGQGTITTSIPNTFIEQVFSNGQVQALPDIDHAGSSPQPFVRASTIKLLDTYQRCGQKVNILVFNNHLRRVSDFISSKKVIITSLQPIIC